MTILRGLEMVQQPASSQQTLKFELLQVLLRQTSDGPI